jgi:hypothetical protein
MFRLLSLGETNILACRLKLKIAQSKVSTLTISAAGIEREKNGKKILLKLDPGTV